jgi:putative hemolysin
LKKKLIEIEDFEKVLSIYKGKWGRRLAKYTCRLFSIDKVNVLYERSSDYRGAEFAESILKDLGINYLIGNAEKLALLKEGPFITVSNHPYGGVDGVMLVDLVAGFRPDYKVMVNQVLSMVEAMGDNFIKVVPKVGRKTPDPTINMGSIREVMAHVKGGHPVGFFPAGAVSMFNMRNLKIRDRQWQEGVVRLIQSMKVPIVPIRFFDKNSPFFYFLDLISWRIRLFRMPYELFNKEDRQIRIGIGDIISVEDQMKYTDTNALGAYLHKVIYDMPVPSTFTFRSDFANPNDKDLA